MPQSNVVADKVVGRDTATNALDVSQDTEACRVRSVGNLGEAAPGENRVVRIGTDSYYDGFQIRLSAQSRGMAIASKAKPSGSAADVPTDSVRVTTR